MIEDALVSQKKKENAVEATKVDVVQSLRSEIDDQHRMLEDELKTIVIQERTWRLKLLLGDKDALDESEMMNVKGEESTNSEDPSARTSEDPATALDDHIGAKGARDFVQRLRLYSEEKKDRVCATGRLSVLLTVYSLDDDLDCENIAVDSSFCSTSSVKSVEEGVWLKGVLEGVNELPESEIEEEEIIEDEDGMDGSWKHTLQGWARLGVKQSQSWRRRLNLTNSLNAYRKRLLLELKEQTEECHFEKGAYPLYSVLRTMMGYVYEQAMNYEQAVFAYSEGALMSQRRLMRNIVQKFASCDFPSKLGQNSNSVVKKPTETVSVCTAKDLETFLIWATGCGDIVKLQAYQFISELLHRRLSRLSGENLDARGIMSRRTMSTTGIGKATNVNPEVSVRSFSRQASGTPRGASAVGLLNIADVSRPDVLNEMYRCKDPCSNPCELTVLLLSKLIEIIRLVCRLKYDAEEDLRTYENDSNLFFSLLKVKMRESVRNAILNSEDFRLFEMMSCELQKVDASSLDDDQKTQFFVNLFNIMTGKLTLLFENL